MPILGTIASSRRIAAAASPDIFLSHDVSPYITAYPFTVASGFGSKYANPSVLPATTATALATSTGGTSVVVGGNNFVSAWGFTPGTGFGSKRTDPATPSFYYSSASLARDNTFLALTNYGSSTGVHGYPYSGTTGIGTKFSNPATLPGPNAEMYSASISNASNNAFFAGYDLPYVLAYPMTSSGFGTKYANPASLPSANNSGGSFSHDDAAVAAASRDNSPFVSAWAWSNTTGFGTRYSNPSSLGLSWCSGTQFHPTGGSIIITGPTAAGSPYVSAYAWSNSTGFGTKYSAPSTTPAQGLNSPTFRSTGNVIAMQTVASPWVIAYAWSNGTGFGTKYSDPASAPTGYAYWVEFPR